MSSLPTHPEPILRIQPMPSDVNMHGDIFGGWIMAQVDIAGGVVAARRAKGRVATVAVNEFVFKHPVLVGDLLSLYAKVARVGRTSITVDVEVYAERGIPDTQVFRVTEATLTYVCVGEDRRPRPVPAE
ncbi:MAG: acyl-CoA thioesterase [Betaproteobacteria bacterium]|nr:acyl-CoA thioesterase [Betaproteobacteria bacterium]MBU6511038.1 acyl-CoA thioesterase [Betaproteobacteria bacterium]MDE2150724.1 acyl-CoA thioesterase [Betaproteobacteria bacterium]MDE2479428.1 acyl-CoA thioesterase [Betaproteobacteria bacterium]